MRYEIAIDLKERSLDIIKKLNLPIKEEDFFCVRSYGSSTKRTIARCHGTSKVLQLALNINPVYVLEFLSERFDKLNEKEKIKIIIHELMHIPKNKGGGFRHHNFVNEKNVNKLYEKYINNKI
ncbi:MAG: putative metallopeptidase [Candidatus Pacearchaeota archaeon]